LTTLNSHHTFLIHPLRETDFNPIAMASSIPNVLQLPLELFRAMLAQTMLARGIKRALRLRLVNRESCVPDCYLVQSTEETNTRSRPQKKE
jgi:hypothetical protein